jgi:predicted DNA-binding protein
MKKKLLSVYLNVETDKKLEKISRELGLSKSDLARLIIEEELQAHEENVEEKIRKKIREVAK